MRTLPATLAAFLTAAGFVSQTAQADHRFTVDDLAHRLKRQAALAAHEVRHGFRHSRHYEHLYADVYEIYALADHISDMTHDGAPGEHIHEDVEKLEQSFHHVEELLDAMRARAGHTRRFGFRHSYSGTSRYHFGRLVRLMGTVGDTIHELHDLVGGSPAAPGETVVPAPPADFRPVPLRGRGGIRLRTRRGGVAFSLTIP